MAKILNFSEFLFEGEIIYKYPGDPYQYKIVNGVWLTKGVNIKDWKSLDGNKKANDILDARHPGARSTTGEVKKSTDPIQKRTEDKTQETDYFPPADNAEVMVCAHAGRWDGAGSSKAENCLKNIESNIKGGTGMIEIDIQITADGVPVLFHDGTLNSKTNGSGKIQNQNWSVIKGISYKSDPSQYICSLQSVVDLIKKYRSNVILQLDKCDQNELSVINNLGILKGIEKQVVAKSTSYNPPSIVNSMGIKWMPILPSGEVGKVTSKEAANRIISKVSPGFFEYQFSDEDSYIVNGYMSDSLRAKKVLSMVVAVGGTVNTNGVSYRGDSKSSWQKIINNVRPSIIMTNRPSQLKTMLGSLK